MTESVDRQTAVLRLRGADDILILCHKNPDGDTIGCAGALYLALKALGKNAAILCSDPIPKMYDYMELRWFDGSFNPAFVVAVDVASIQLFGENNNVPQYAAHTNLCIDHHASNSGYAYETLLDPGAAAACEFLLDVIVDMGVTITPQIANCLYTGIATDTGCFKFASTTPRTHMAAARLMEAGADVEKLNARLFESRSHARITAERMAMESLEYYFNDLCAVICLTWDQIESSGVAGAELEDLTSLRVSQCVDYKPSDDGAARHGDAMREEPCKTYGHLFPADQHIADAVGAVLSDWNIPECTELEGDIFRISFEGVFFPLDDVLDALRPLLCAESSGKIDLIDMEAWTLTRAAFSGTEITVKTVGLNHVLAYSGH